MNQEQIDFIKMQTPITPPPEKWFGTNEEYEHEMEAENI